MSYAGITFNIYTDKRDNLKELTSKYFSNFSLIPMKGVFKRQTEDGIIIRITSLDPDQTRTKISALSQEIKEVNKQKAVCITESTTRVTILE